MAIREVVGVNRLVLLICIWDRQLLFFAQRMIYLYDRSFIFIAAKIVCALEFYFTFKFSNLVTL